MGRRPNQRGITLVEVMVAGLLGIVAIGTINWFSRYQLFSLRNQAVQNDIQMTARSVSDVFSRDVRRSGFNPTCNADITAVELAKGNELTLKSDLNADGALGGIDETLTYRVATSSSGTRFERAANGRTDVLLDQIDASRTRFRFYDNAGAEIPSGPGGLGSAERSQVRRIRLELAVAADAVDPQRAMPVLVRLANDVDIRNRHFVNNVSCP